MHIRHTYFRTVVIDTEDVDTYSINEIDERVIQARLEAEILEATTQELLLQEYPSDCCPESYYLRFPCLVGDPDSPFWMGPGPRLRAIPPPPGQGKWSRTPWSR